MSGFVPTLSSAGWIRTIEEKADYALGCFLTSEYSQSVLFEDSISSLQYLVRTYGNSPSDLQYHCQEALSDLMRNYFADVDTRVEVSAPDPNAPNQLKILFRCIVRDKGKEWSVGKRVQFINGRLAQIIPLNNG